ncbi:hypothetical protein E6C27_scaffold137G00650 [Cucumis melo var. makuwa]|uniref:Uncharacterized protein n=1 Tax=Cucumis melo var. makuwa TaxID=1194695 RepID=A0A5A7V2V0_CUCMM|nr:hypothetical protein E6C27_scaffold137G00650 [Cucumis melo var. makuwa]
MPTRQIMPTRHDSTISMDKIMFIYCIIEEIPRNVSEIICEHIIACVKHPHDARPFPHLIEELCLKACMALEKIPRTVDTPQTLIVTLLDPASKEKPSLDNPQTDQGDDSFQNLFQDSICNPLAFIGDAFKASDNTAQTLVVSASKEGLKKVVDDPLQKGKETFEVADETSLSSPPKQTPKPTTHNAKKKEATRDDEMMRTISSSSLMITFINHKEVDLKMYSNVNPTCNRCNCDIKSIWKIWSSKLTTRELK